MVVTNCKLSWLILTFLQCDGYGGSILSPLCNFPTCIINELTLLQ